MTAKILAPHTEQDGWVYVRVERKKLRFPRRWEASISLYGIPGFAAGDEGNSPEAYSDDRIGSRIISSRRAERAVETDDFLRLCAEEGLRVVRSGHCLEWAVFDEFSQHPEIVIGSKTLREAYYRYRAKVDAS